MNKNLVKDFVEQATKNDDLDVLVVGIDHKTSHITSAFIGDIKALGESILSIIYNNKSENGKEGGKLYFQLIRDLAYSIATSDTGYGAAMREMMEGALAEFKKKNDHQDAKVIQMFDQKSN